MDAHFPIRRDHGLARPALRRLACKDPSDAVEERRGSGRTNAQNEHAVMRARHKAAHVGKIEILRDEKAAGGLCCGPNARIVESRETFSSNGVDLVTKRG